MPRRAKVVPAGNCQRSSNACEVTSVAGTWRPVPRMRSDNAFNAELPRPKARRYRGGIGRSNPAPYANAPPTMHTTDACRTRSGRVMQRPTHTCVCARAQHDAADAATETGSIRFHLMAWRLQARQIAIRRRQPADRQHREGAAIRCKAALAMLNQWSRMRRSRSSMPRVFAAPELATALMQAACKSSRGS